MESSYLGGLLTKKVKSNQVEIQTDTRSQKSVARLREPREFFILKESAYEIKWPLECQVVDIKTHLTGTVPSEPEPYYSITGKEICVKRIGENPGEVVYINNLLTPSLDYFYKSGLPSRIPQDLKQSKDLKFESRFESGNLEKAVKISETYYELSLRADLYTKNKHMQWFYFLIENTRKDVLYRFSIVNLLKVDSLYKEGMRPVMYSTKDAVLNNVGWKRCGTNISYYQNEIIGDEEPTTYTLTFNIEFPHDDDCVYLAHSYPYTYTDLQDYLAKLQNHPVKKSFTRLRLLCKTLAGNNVYYLTVTEPQNDEEITRVKKKYVVFTARVHPGEAPSSWIMKGLIDYITGDSAQAKELRGKFVFKLIPMLNPDGVIVGNNRCSLSGKDLNRQYKTVLREVFPPVFHTRLMIKRLVEEAGVLLYCDLHAHSRKHNVFVYGCENRKSTEVKLQEQIFPLMLHKNTADKFSFESCKFRVQKEKEGTGRVYFWMLGVENSYTLEASFAGSTIGSRCCTHFNTGDYENMGKSFLETLLDFVDNEESKQILSVEVAIKNHCQVTTRRIQRRRTSKYKPI